MKNKYGVVKSNEEWALINSISTIKTENNYIACEHISQIVAKGSTEEEAIENLKKIVDSKVEVIKNKIEENKSEWKITKDGSVETIDFTVTEFDLPALENY